MSCRSVPFVKEAVLVAAAFLLMVPQLGAGDRVHAPTRPAAQSQLASIPVVRAVPRSVGISVVVAIPVAPATEPLSVAIRGPDGQVQRFPVEGGRAAIHYRQVTLRPGEMVTIRWAPAK